MEGRHQTAVLALTRSGAVAPAGSGQPSLGLYRHTGVCPGNALAAEFTVSKQNKCQICRQFAEGLYNSVIDMSMKKKYRVLAVDDEPAMIEWLKILLEHEGYEVRTAMIGTRG